MFVQTPEHRGDPRYRGGFFAWHENEDRQARLDWQKSVDDEHPKVMFHSGLLDGLGRLPDASMDAAKHQFARASRCRLNHGSGTDCRVGSTIGQLNCRRRPMLTIQRLVGAILA